MSEVLADVIDYQIIGHDLQIVEVSLDPQESVQAEAGAMLYMDQSVEMETSISGGLLKGFRRMISGSGFFITSFTNNGNKRASVAFAAPFCGKVIPIDLQAHKGELLCQKDAFLCAAKGVDIDVAFNRKLGSGIFSKEGFILQKLKGDGLAFIHAGGAIVKKTLTPGDILKVDAGCLVAFESSINFDIKFVGGFKNTLFGGEGVFFAQLTGAGEVYIQSLPISRLAARIGLIDSNNRSHN